MYESLTDCAERLRYEAANDVEKTVRPLSKTVAGGELYVGDFLTVTEVPVDIAVPLDGRSKPITALGTVVGTSKQYKASGEAVAAKYEGQVQLLASGQSNGGQTANYSCVTNSSNSDFHLIGVIPITENNGRYKADWRIHAYWQYRARPTGDLGTTNQAEACSVGGFDSQNGYRTLENGMAMTTNSTDGRHRIGANGSTGDSLSAVSATLGFKATLKQIVEVSGSLSQNAVGRNAWAPGAARYRLATDAFYQNANSAWWATTQSRHFNASGSTDFQAQVAHTLWEYPQSARDIQLQFNAYAVYRCPYYCSA